ncbi:MAG: hypothetical protein M3Y54_04260 [Bacteroidota bacterium]|nr:hypothetical protein [Bacteroidota bacterium]
MRELLLFGLISGFLPVANAQRSLSVLAVGQVHTSQNRFADDAPVSARVSLPPGIYTSWGVGAAVGLSARSAVQVTVAYASFGVDIATQRDYVRQRYAFANVTSFREAVVEVAVVKRRYFPQADRLGRAWFVDAGVDALIGAFGSASIDFASYDPNNANSQGIAGTSTPLDGNPYRLGIRLGAGREWNLTPRNAVALQLIASIGLRDLSRYQLSTVVWQQGRTIDPVYYQNTVALRGSFVGLQVRYRFRILGAD